MFFKNSDMRIEHEGGEKTRKKLKPNKIRVMFLVITIFAILVSVSSVIATPTSSQVYVSVNGSDTNNGSAEAPYLTIQQGVDSVSENGTVTILNGVYNGTRNTNITISKSMNITGQSQTGTIINGTGTNWIFNIPKGLIVTIQNLTLTNATTDHGLFIDSYGGAICNHGTLNLAHCIFTGNFPGSTGYGLAIYNDGTMTVTDCSFTGNNASQSDGVIYNAGGNLSLTNCTFTNNSAVEGGAVYNYGDNKWFNVTIRDCTFVGNSVRYWGGAICSLYYCNMTVSNCTFIGNSADMGAAIFNDDYSNATVSNCTFSGNNASNYGGAIHNGATMTVTSCSFINNNCTDWGGAINNWATMTVSNCSFIDNSAEQNGGGAIENDDTMTVLNCSFTGNTAGYGGSIYNSYAKIEIKGCTFMNNTATGPYSSGGAIYNSNGDLGIKGCTLTGNSAEQGGAIYNYYGQLTANFNRIVGNTASEGSALYNAYSSTADVENNWWGSNTNPKTINNLIACYVDGVDADPWLILSVNATPSEIFNSQTSNVTVDLYTDSNNNSHSSESSKYPAVIPVTFTTTWGSIIGAVLNYGTGLAIFTANGGAIPTPNVVTVSVADGANLTAMVNTDIIIKPAANLYVNIKSSKSNPKVGETFTITYKLGNNGPDTATNVTTTIPVPKNFEISSITGDGNWTYNETTRTITWTLMNVPKGDPYLYITGKTMGAGVYSFGSAIDSDTYNLNTQGVTPITINAASGTNADSTTGSTTDNMASVNAASGTVSMQNTGLPFNYLILAVLTVFSGFVMPKRK